MNRAMALTQFNILVVGHDEDDVGPDVPAVPLDAAPQALGPGGDKGPAARTQLQGQQGHAAQPLHQHGAPVAGRGEGGQQKKKTGVKREEAEVQLGPARATSLTAPASVAADVDCRNREGGGGRKCVRPEVMSTNEIQTARLLLTRLHNYFPNTDSEPKTPTLRQGKLHPTGSKRKRTELIVIRSSKAQKKNPPTP